MNVEILDNSVFRNNQYGADYENNYDYAIECRNPNYLKSAFFEFLSGHHLGCVLLDGYYMPPIEEVISSHNINTASYTIVRLQGKDRQGMDTKTDNNNSS